MNRDPASPHLPRVAIIVFNRFSPFHFSVPAMIFGNSEIHDRPMFDMKIIAGEDGPITSDIGMEIKPEGGLEKLIDFDFIIVPYWHNVETAPSIQLIEKLKAAHQNGSTLIGLCLGGYVLAYSGLLENRTAAMHWNFESDFTTRFPSIKVDHNALYVEEDRIITSAGIAANIDCSLHVFRQCYGSKEANQLARKMVVSPHREGGQAQYIERPVPVNTADTRINELLDSVRKNIELSYTIDELADSVILTRRTFTRKFNKATGMSFGQWLMTERLHQAQELLEETDLSIEVVSDRVGFSSVFVFRDKFKTKFQVTPSEWRKTFRY
ncbi:helix-turn-helix domain-containing protein [Aliivibrio fischeri]|uniref:GlxA family transcriptional regulator n=1 Tax=Aliivibrio fischeri TaxID=668 RepID=UPI0012D8E904|nr:helix-turn-helix domain-containing protein [Aliivibrio fischeri]MUH96242.1 helix-turn-helix domain-containing protein [Aliivibrio fischeri]MUI62496.1 helix-turn-helix domain-containing protein [Aliivibrio fischeri]